MKLLIITNNPDRASFRQRVEVYLDLLAEGGIDCEVKKFPSDLFGRRKLLLSSDQYDAVFLQKRRLNPLDVLSLRGRCKKIIYDFDDAIMFNDKFPEKLSSKRQNDFKRTVKLADTVICGNRFLSEQTQRYNSNVEVLPTGLDIKPYDLRGVREDSLVRLVWIGSKSTLMYLYGIKAALEQIGAMCDNVVLRIICDAFFDLDNMPVEKCEWSLQTQARYLVGSDIGLAPLPDNNFTKGKCGFKILQYQAAGLATVASPVGVNAELVEPGQTGFHAVDEGQWIEKIQTLVTDAQLRESMRTNSLQTVKDFDLPIIGHRLCQIIRNVIETP